MKSYVNYLNFVCGCLIVITFYFFPLQPIHGQSTSASFDCSNHNAFLSNGQVNQIRHLVTRIARDGTLYLDNKYDDSLSLIIQRITQTGTTFQLISESNSALDTNKTYKKYREYYYGIEVESGGYSMSFIRPGGPGPCVLLPQMLSPAIKTGISLNLTPSIASTSLPSILSVSHVDRTELVITHSITNQCEYKLVYRTTYTNGARKIAYIDAHTGTIIYTREATMGVEIDAPTYTYGNVSFENRKVSSVTHLQSNDQRLSVFDQQDDCPTSLILANSAEWQETFIPSTSASEWTNESLPEVYQAFYVASKILPLYDKLGIHFTKYNIGSCTEDGAFTIDESDYNEAWSLFGRLGDKTTALFDVVGHEMAHSFMSAEGIGYNTPGNESIQEGIADIFGTYLERQATGTLDWVIADDEPDVADVVGRDLAHTPSEIDCFTEVKDFGEHNRYDRSRPMSRWFYLLSTGAGDIQALPMYEVVGILKDAISQSPSDVDYPQLMAKTLIVVEDSYGACSQEFESIARAWEAICVDTDLPTENGLVVTCYFSLIGENYVCEEDDHLELCVDGGLPNANYIFTIFGPENTSFTSECGMQGNSQEGCACLTLTDFPKYPYYPQILTIDVYATNDNVPFKQRHRLILLDCNEDDPTCEEYYDLDPFRVINNKVSTNSNNFEIQKQETSNNNRLSEQPTSYKSEIIVYDVLGRKIYQGLKNEFDISQIQYYGVAFITEFNKSNRAVKITKTIILPN